MDSVEEAEVEVELKSPLPLFDLSSLPPVAIRTASALTTSGGLTSWLTWGQIQLDKNPLENPPD